MSHGTMKYHRLTILALLLLFELPRHRVTAETCIHQGPASESYTTLDARHDPERSPLDGWFGPCPGIDTRKAECDDKCPSGKIACHAVLTHTHKYYCEKGCCKDNAADEATAASFGQGIEVFGKTGSTEHPFDYGQGQISWVVELNGIGFGLCDSKRNAFYVWNTVNGADTDNLPSVALAPLSNPVGAIHSQVETHLVYIACFGSAPNSDSGIAIVDISDLQQPRLVGAVTYPDPQMHVHNVYEFDFLQGQPEVTVAVLGNPWLKPALAGHGLVQFDRNTRNFRPGDDPNRLNVRSAKQAAPGKFYAVTQEPWGVATQVVRLEQTTPEANTPHKLKIIARSVLPTRVGGDGGADVVLGLESNTVWFSDRWDQAGRLYYYKYDPPSTTAGDGTFDLVATHVATGKNARYTMITHKGDIVVCNEGSSTLTKMKGLALNPQQLNPEVVTINTVPVVQFYLESTLLPSSSVALPIASPITNPKKKVKKGKK